MGTGWYEKIGKGFFATCPFTGRKVHGAETRSLRHTHTPEDKMPKGNATECPFCPGNERSQLPELLRFHPEQPHWRYFSNPEELHEAWLSRAFPNLYKREREPSKHILWRAQHYKNLPGGAEHIAALQDMYGKKFQERGLDIQEQYFFDPNHIVIVGTPSHLTEEGTLVSTATMAHEEFHRELHTGLLSRAFALSLDERLQYGYIYKNQGFRAGATQTHEHIQLRCYEDYAHSSKLYQHFLATHHQPHLMGNILDFVATQDWLLKETEDALAFTVPWEEFPGVWVVAKMGSPHFSTDTLSEGFSRLLQDVIKAFEAAGEHSCNFGLFDSTKDYALHPHAKLITRAKARGGTDIFFGPENHNTTPESFARLLRENLSNS